MAGRIQKTWLSRFEEVKLVVQEHFPDLSIRDLCKLLGKLGTYHYNKQNVMILGKHKKLYNSLIESGFNPFTVYRWALLERVPEDIRFQLRNHRVSQKKASSLWFKRRHETEASLQREIQLLGVQIVRGM